MKYAVTDHPAAVESMPKSSRISGNSGVTTPVPNGPRNPPAKIAQR